MIEYEKLPVVQAGLSGPVAGIFRKIVSLERVPLELEAVAATRAEYIGKRLIDFDPNVHPLQADVPIISIDDAIHNTDAPVVFSNLRNEEAKEFEDDLAEGRLVATNASANRMRADVALANAYITAGKIRDYLKEHNNAGIIANGNCTAIILSVALAELNRRLKIQSINADTLQGWTGAGKRDVPKEFTGKVIPIGGDEKEKIETEPLLLMGASDRNPNIKISANPQRAPWILGHYIRAEIHFKKPASLAEIKRILKRYESPAALKEFGGSRILPALHPIYVSENPLVRTQGNNMILRRFPSAMRSLVHIEDFNDDNPNHAVLGIAGDNLVLGAAGSSVMNILYAYALGEVIH